MPQYVTSLVFYFSILPYAVLCFVLYGLWYLCTFTKGDSKNAYTLRYYDFNEQALDDLGQLSSLILFAKIVKVNPRIGNTFIHSVLACMFITCRALVIGYGLFILGPTIVHRIF